MKEQETRGSGSLRSTLARSAKIATVVLVLLIGAVVAAAWIAGDPAELPFEYEGFD